MPAAVVTCGGASYFRFDVVIVPISIVAALQIEIARKLGIVRAGPLIDFLERQLVAAEIDGVANFHDGKTLDIPGAGPGDADNRNGKADMPQRRPELSAAHVPNPARRLR